MARVIIYRPTKSAMQSGVRNTRRWVVEFERTQPMVTDPLMGWIGSADTQRQVRLSFDSREAAIAYAERNGFEYICEQPRASRLRPKNYAEKFLSNRVE